MPFYNYRCPECGSFERRAGYNDGVVLCACGREAGREAVYHTNHIIEGRALPSDPTEVQNEFFKEVRKRGWSEDRAVTEMRANMIEDNQGRKFLNTKAMTQEA